MLTYGSIWGDGQARVAGLRPTDESRLDIVVFFQIFNGVAAALLRRRYEAVSAKTRGRMGYKDSTIYTEFTLKVIEGNTLLPDDLPNLGGDEIEIYTLCDGCPKLIPQATTISETRFACTTPFAPVVYLISGSNVRFYGKQMLAEVNVRATLFNPVNVMSQEAAMNTTYPLPMDLYDEAMMATIARIMNAEQVIDDKINDENDNNKVT